MPDVDLDIALDRLITEMVINVSTKAIERQTRIDSFLRVVSLALTPDEVDGVAISTGSVRIEVEAMMRDIERAYKQMVVTSVQTGRDDVQKLEGPDKDWEWSVESDNPCGDCIDRDGQIRTYAEWQEIGLPRTGTTICGANCKCVLNELDSGEKDPYI